MPQSQCGRPFDGALLPKLSVIVVVNSLVSVAVGPVPISVSIELWCSLQLTSVTPTRRINTSR